jgi:hypothetical protein
MEFLIFLKVNAFEMSNDAYYLKTALILIANASKYFEMFGREAGLKMTEKNDFTHQLKKLNSIETWVRLKTSPELAHIIRKEISENWETLSVQNVLGMMVQMDDEKRRQVEEFTEKLLNK